MDEITRSGRSQQIVKPSETTSIQTLTENAREYLESAKSDATKRAYRSDWKKFSEWASPLDLTCLPAEPTTLALYITHMADEGRAVSTIYRTMTAISQAHKTMGLQPPTNAPEVVEVFKGIRRARGGPQKRAKPLVLSELKRVIDAIGQSYLGSRDKALLLIGWAAALRRCELVSLNFSDARFVDEGLVLTINRSKTDQSAEGFQLGIPHAQDQRYCAVARLNHWIGVAPITRGPLFFPIGTAGKDRWHARVTHRPNLSPRSVNLILHKRLKNAGISPAGYSGHSLRAGFVTSAAKLETPEHLIQFHTRHRTTATLRGYIREGSLFSSNPLSMLL